MVMLTWPESFWLASGQQGALVLVCSVVHGWIAAYSERSRVPHRIQTTGKDFLPESEIVTPASLFA
jgi:hypothetical protein